ncbi:DNA damage-inducible transcript 4-like protein [Neosynchiropus ocellatus]
MVYTAALLFGPGLPVPSGETSVIDMIGRYLFPAAVPGRERSCVRRGSVESCEELDSRAVHWEEPGEQLLHQDVTRQIERCLTEAKSSTLHCQVLMLPRRMSVRVGQDVIRSSAEEPCGLRGASIKVYVEDKDEVKPVGSVRPDPGITPTFELSVVFRAVKDDGWPPLKHIFETKKKVLKLRPEYRLVKRKLYSSASPVVHEFS